MTGCTVFDCTAPAVGYIGETVDGLPQQRAFCRGHMIDRCNELIDAGRPFSLTPWQLLAGPVAA